MKPEGQAAEARGAHGDQAFHAGSRFRGTPTYAVPYNDRIENHGNFSNMESVEFMITVAI